MTSKPIETTTTKKGGQKNSSKDGAHFPHSSLEFDPQHYMAPQATLGVIPYDGVPHAQSQKIEKNMGFQRELTAPAYLRTVTPVKEELFSEFIDEEPAA